MNPYDTPKADSGQDNILTKRNPPPPIVRLSVAGLALSLSLGIAKIVFLAFRNGSIRYVGFFIGINILIVIILLLLRGLYRGSKVAFWITIAHAVFGIIAYKYSMDQFAQLHTQWEKGLYLFQGIIQYLSAAALLSPPSWRWFHLKKQQSESSPRD